MKYFFSFVQFLCNFHAINTLKSVIIKCKNKVKKL